MHELSIAQNIIEIVEDYAEKNNAKRVTEIVVDVGTISGVVPDNLEFTWEIAVNNTISEGALLKINLIKAKAICLECNNEFNLNDICSICEFCQSVKYKIIQGRELMVKSIIIE